MLNASTKEGEQTNNNNNNHNKNSTTIPTNCIKLKEQEKCKHRITQTKNN